MFSFLANLHLSASPDSVPRWARIPINRITRRAVVATLPGWRRHFDSIPQFGVIDVAVKALVRPLLRFVDRRPTLTSLLTGVVSPLSVPLSDPFVAATPARAPRTCTVEAAREQLGDWPAPRAIYAAQLAARTEGRHAEPYERQHHDTLLDSA